MEVGALEKSGFDGLIEFGKEFCSEHTQLSVGSLLICMLPHVPPLSCVLYGFLLLWRVLGVE